MVKIDKLCFKGVRLGLGPEPFNKVVMLVKNLRNPSISPLGCLEEANISLKMHLHNKVYCRGSKNILKPF